jgi:hypothetical protein
MDPLTAAIRFDFEKHPAARNGILLLLAFLITFLITRFWVRMQRSGPDWWPSSLNAGGTHVHHLVPGIFLVLICGFLATMVDPRSAGFAAVVIGFGIGAALTLDEYALWLHLEDVYWAEEGRRSVDLIAVALGLGLLIVLGAKPFGLGDGSRIPTVALVALVGVEVMLVSICALKGKLYMAGFGIFIPLVAWIGALRAARPDSWWARRRYAERPDLLEKGRLADEKWSSRRTRWWDAVGGKHGD